MYGIGSALPTHWMPLPDAPAEGNEAQSIADVVRDAVIETAARPATRRGPYVFDEATLQAQARGAKGNEAETAAPAQAPRELVERLRRMRTCADGIRKAVHSNLTEFFATDVIALDAAIAALSQEQRGAVETADDDLSWIMSGDLAPTRDEIYVAGNKWCGDKERETFASDHYYFRENWSALNGLKAYVAREIAERAKLGERRRAALAATPVHQEATP
jgi:hypothetical protein